MPRRAHGNGRVTPRASIVGCAVPRVARPVALGRYLRAYLPARYPTMPVTVIASGLQDTARAAARAGGAPPARAPTTPSTASASSATAAVATTRADEGTVTATITG